MVRGTRALAVSSTLFVAALVGPGSASGQSQPQPPPNPCPDSFILTPVQAVPPADADTDRNGNGFVCAKINQNPHAGLVVVDDARARHLPPI
ncbi:MAG TPA: hypothetical protein VF517_11445 [Thermoleophilaceae bacterium]